MPSRKKNRCNICNKKLGLMPQTCRFCSNNYCLHHCAIEGHDCEYKEVCIKEHKERNKIDLNSGESNFIKVPIIS
jgi:hypothetical protein